jgi:4-hydroxyphenylpyruvate dioxygenase-like putative hemolysin
MENENANLLNEIYKATKMGLKATQIIIPKVHDEPLREHIERQGDNYKGMSAKAQEMLQNTGEMPKGQDEMKEAMLWGSITVNTMINKKPTHIAEMMISGTTMGIIDMTKKLNELDAADAGSKKLAEEYIANEQKNIEELKKHL